MLVGEVIYPHILAHDSQWFRLLAVSSLCSSIAHLVLGVSSFYLTLIILRSPSPQFGWNIDLIWPMDVQHHLLIGFFLNPSAPQHQSLPPPGSVRKGLAKPVEICGSSGSKQILWGCYRHETWLKMGKHGEKWWWTMRFCGTIFRKEMAVWVPKICSDYIVGGPQLWNSLT